MYGTNNIIAKDIGNIIAEFAFSLRVEPASANSTSETPLLQQEVPIRPNAAPEEDCGTECVEATMEETMILDGLLGTPIVAI